MPFTNYNDLLASVDNWLGQRPELQASYPDFVMPAEQRMYRELRAREMIRRGRALLNEQYENLPFDFLKMKRVSASPGSANTAYSKVRLTGMRVGQIEDNYGDYMASMPEAYCTEGLQIRFAPQPTPQTVPPQTLDVTPYRYFETVYYCRFARLGPATDAQSNVILQTYPELYLYGALIEAEPYLIDDDRIVLWKGMFDEAVNRINNMAEVDGEAAMTVGAA
jgi:hypothetical protein